MRPHEFINVFANSTVAWPLAVSMQEAGRIYRLGSFLSLSPTSVLPRRPSQPITANGFI